MNVSPLVSIIIPCFNHGKYLSEAINSIIAQTYTHFEIVVVDDGSTDNTAEVSAGFPFVKYIYQTNQGLSAARNAGLEVCSGSFLVFLDADDWLFPKALSLNLKYLLDDRSLAFVSGAHRKVNFRNELLEGEKTLSINDYYLRMLNGNYIEMHATVMYARWVFDEFRYDVSLKACEDYDLYLNIARKYQVKHHNGLIAAYRFHNKNMSGNASLMLVTALESLQRQESFLRNDQEKNNWCEGLKFYKKFYCDKILSNFFSGKTAYFKNDLLTLFKYPAICFSCFYSKVNRKTKKILISLLPFPILKFLHKLGMHKNFVPR